MENCKKCGASGKMTQFTSNEGDYSLCLNCAADFAKKRIKQSYIAIAIGLFLGILLLKNDGVSLKNIVFYIILFPYAVWGTFFGWHFGGKIWSKLRKISDNWMYGNVLFVLKITISYFIGIFGGGISQFITYRKMIKEKEMTGTL